jgi:polysaccharide biosynthesis/export protein
MKHDPAPRSPLPALAGALLLALMPVPARAQQPSAAQVQGALQQPGLADAVRQRIGASGLTPDQIRARLRASGYPATLLDAYLGGTVPGQGSPEPGFQELAAIQALGLAPVSQPFLAVDTGLIRARGGDKPSRVFGVDVFRRSTTQFLPLLAGPVPADYRLGAGDQLVLILTGDVELTYALPVTREGFILIPQVGQVYVSSLTLDQLRRVLYDRLGRVYSGVRRTNATTRFDVTVSNVRANQVYVVGEVAQPGAYQVSSLGTALTALYAAGGVTERGNLRAVELLRGGKPAATLDLYGYLLRGDTRADVRLETGDVVFVPVHGLRVEVTGAVTRPAIYEQRAGETLEDLVEAAGGFRPDAALTRIAVHRVTPAPQRGPGAFARQVVDVEMDSPGGGAIPAIALQDGDSVVVDSVPALNQQLYVGIAGMVQKPGAYPWRPGMTLRELVAWARGPRIGASLREAEIARLPADRAEGQLATTIRVPLDSTYLFERDASGRYIGAAGVSFPAPGSAADVPLEPFDNVLIFRQPDFELQRTVTITGEVQYPGTYALKAKDDRLLDLIERAGRLTPRAYAEGIRFVRAAGDAGRINIDLPRVLRDAGARDNVILQPGDSVNIPEFQPSVRVVGAVNSPGSVLYKRGAGLDYYLSAAGGFNRLADRSAVSVRFANGEVRTRGGGFLFFGGGAPSPGPGSDVYVPAKDPSAPRTDYVSLFGAVAQILASTVAIIVVVTNRP